jgi:hypothetical protein
MSQLVRDPTHPIPDVSTIDVVTEFDCGAYYGLVVARPIDGSERSQARLLDKIENYIGDFHSAKSLGRVGSPSPERCRIRVKLNRESDPTILELLERCRPWVHNHGIGLDIELFDP